MPLTEQAIPAQRPRIQHEIAPQDCKGGAEQLPQCSCIRLGAGSRASTAEWRTSPVRSVPRSGCHADRSPAAGVVDSASRLACCVPPRVVRRRTQEHTSDSVRGAPSGGCDGASCGLSGQRPDWARGLLHGQVTPRVWSACRRCEVVCSCPVSVAACSGLRFRVGDVRIGDDPAGCAFHWVLSRATRTHP